MADRRLLEYEEARLPDGPYWTLIIERSSAGAPAGLVTIHYRSVDGSLPESQMTVVMDDLTRLVPALAWANEVEDPGLGRSHWRSVDAEILRLRRVAKVYEEALHKVSVMGRMSRSVAGDPLAMLAEAALTEAKDG